MEVRIQADTLENIKEITKLPIYPEIEIKNDVSSSLTLSSLVPIFMGEDIYFQTVRMQGKNKQEELIKFFRKSALRAMMYGHISLNDFVNVISKEDYINIYKLKD